MLEHLRAIWRYRELLTGLIRKELKVKYQDSSLGFVWSMLSPAMYLVVFYIVFKVILQSGIPNFAVYLLSGLLLWNVFSISVSTAVTVIVGNGSLVNKVYFPREILPLATVGANLVHFFMQAGVLIIALVLFGYDFGLGYLWLVPIAVVTVVMFASALAILFSALNVYARDLQHLLELVMLAWFWLTPVVYPYGLAAGELEARGASPSLLLLNPMVPPILTFQRVFYNVVQVDGNPPQVILPDASTLWYFRNLMIVLAASTLLLVFAIRVFGKLEASFAETL